jgi:hypothetical protein
MKALLRLILIACVLAEIFAAMAVVVTIASLVLLPSLVRRGAAQASVSVRDGRPFWTFNARLPHTTDANFSFDPAGTTFTPPAYGSVSLGPLQLKEPVTTDPLPSSGAQAARASFDHVQCMVTLKDSGAAAGALRSVVWPLGVGITSTGLLSLFILDRIRRMFKSVREGDVFTSANVHRVFGIGWALIAYSLLSSATSAWLLVRIMDWFESHAILEQVRPGVVLSNGYSFPMVGIRGLVLQEESRLTI